MRATRFYEYGPPDVLRLEEVPTPVPADDQVLVRIRAASVNPLDWRLMRGEPLPIRIMTGLRRPKASWIGVDFAGVVEAVGKNVTQFQIGDAVFGVADGAFAEFVAVAAAEIVRKPDNLTFEEAAAVPVGAITALQSLRQARVEGGQKVLIPGAAGGVGTFAVQLAKSFGAEVTGVCSTANVGMVRGLGADHVVDYTREDFTRGNERYDVLLDVVGTRPLRACRRVLGPNGTYIAIGGPGGRWIGPLAALFKPIVMNPFVTQTLGACMSKTSRDDLATLRDLLAAGTIRPVIDRAYPLSEVREAVRYVETMHARGKVVIVTT